MATRWADRQYGDPNLLLHACRKEAAIALANSPVPHSHVYQFGVWVGHSMEAIQKLWAERGLPISHMWGFDSFEGLPAETVDRTATDPAWFAGNFSAQTDFGVSTRKEAIDRVGDRLDPSVPLTLVAGFWDRSLRDPQVLSLDMRPASYIDVDCDIYSSARLALDFVFSRGIAVPGTLVGYHDWGVPEQGGERRAHREATAEHDVAWETVWEDPAQAVFRVKRVGRAAAAFPGLGGNPHRVIEDGHLGGTSPTGDPDSWFPELWEWLAGEFSVRTMLDVGCGAGLAQCFFEGLGVQTTGLEGSEKVIACHRLPSRVVRHDLTGGPWCGGVYDLVWCCEVAEHIEEDRLSNLLVTLSSCCGRVLAFSAAPEGAGGYHHVNCRDPGYWVEKLTRAGFRYEEGLTRKALSFCPPVHSWGRGPKNYFLRSGLIFTR